MKNNTYIQSIERAAIILDYIAAVGAAKLNEICQHTGLKTSTAFGIIRTLEYTGQLTRSVNSLEYTLGLNSLKFGISYLGGSGLLDKIHSLLLRLVAQVDETAYFEIKTGDRYYYLDYVVSSQPLKVVPDTDRFIELPRESAVAQVFDSSEPDLKYTTDIEGVEKGLNCCAIPYRNFGRITACLAFTGPACRFTSERIHAAYGVYINTMHELGMESHI